MLARLYSVCWGKNHANPLSLSNMFIGADADLLQDMQVMILDLLSPSDMSGRKRSVLAHRILTYKV